MIQRETLLEQHPYLNDLNLPMIIHNDIDAILSACILHHFLGWEVVGFYDLKELWVSASYTRGLEEVVFVDLDITKAGMRSIGHHVVSLTSTHINPNLWIPVGTNNYTDKYPLNTSLLLYFLLQQPLPTSTKALYLLSLADSVWSNAQTYWDNVYAWLERLALTSLVPLLQAPQFGTDMQTKVIPSLLGTRGQCNFNARNQTMYFSTPKNGKWFTVQSLINTYAPAFGYRTLTLPTDLIRTMVLTKQHVQIDPPEFEAVYANLQTQYDIFSHSLKKKNELAFSHF